METTNYNLAVFGTTDYLSYDPVEEEKRFVLIDALLGIFASALGKGVVSGLTLPVGYTYIGTKLLKFTSGVVLVPGVGGTPVLRGDVSAAQGDTGVDLTAYPTKTNWVIYVQATNNTPLTGEVEFFVADTTPSQGVLVATFSTLGTDGAISAVTLDAGRSILISTDARTAIYSHTHDGSDAPYVDLSTAVTGTLPATNLPNIPSSMIQGIVPTTQFTISHNDLLDSGFYTHAQLDSFYNALVTSGNVDTYKSMSITNLRNRLLLGTEFQKVYGAITGFTNEVYILPDVSLTGLNDTDTTVTFDTSAYIGAVGSTIASETWHAVWGGENLAAANTEYLEYAEPIGLSTILLENTTVHATYGTDYEHVTLSTDNSVEYILEEGTLHLQYDAIGQATFNSLDLTIGIPAGTSVKLDVWAHDLLTDTEVWTTIDTYTTSLSAVNVATSYANKRYFDIKFTLLTTEDYSTFTPSIDIVALNWSKTKDITSLYMFTEPLTIASTLTHVFVSPIEEVPVNTRVDYRVGTVTGQSWDNAVPVIPNQWNMTFPVATQVFVIAKVSSGSTTTFPTIHGLAYQFSMYDRSLMTITP